MEDHYFKSRESGCYAAWPLFTPANPDYGQWSWLHIRKRSLRFKERYPNQPAWRVRFIRPLTDVEVSIICREYVVWGMKITNHQWALVRGRRGGTGTARYSISSDTSRSVGV